MKIPVLNIIVAVLGAFLVFSGMQKLLGNYSGMEFHAGNIGIKIPSHDSLFYIIVINFLGGTSMCFHAIATYRFKKPLVDKFESDMRVSPSEAIQPANISKLSMAGAIISIIIGIWFVIELIILMTGFQNFSSGFYGFAAILFLLNAPFAIAPIMLVGKNLALSSRLGQLVDDQQKHEVRSRSLASRRTRR